MNETTNYDIDNSTLVLYRSQLAPKEKKIAKEEKQHDHTKHKQNILEGNNNIWCPSELKKQSPLNNKREEHNEISSSHTNFKEEDRETSHRKIGKHYGASTAALLNDTHWDELYEEELSGRLNSIFEKNSIPIDKLTVQGVYRSEIVYILNQILLKFNVENDSSFPFKFFVIDSDNLNRFDHFLNSLNLDRRFVEELSQFKIHILLLFDRKSQNLSSLKKTFNATNITEILSKILVSLKKEASQFGILVKYTQALNKLKSIFKYLKLSEDYKIVGYFYCGRYRLKRNKDVLVVDSGTNKSYNSKITIFGVDSSLNFLYNRIIEIENRHIKELPSQFVYNIFKKFNKNANNIIKMRKLRGELDQFTPMHINVKHTKKLTRGEAVLMAARNDLSEIISSNKRENIDLSTKFNIPSKEISLDRYAQATELFNEEIFKKNMLDCMKYGADMVAECVKENANVLYLSSNSEDTSLRSLILNSLVFDYRPLDFIASNVELRRYIEQRINFNQLLDTKYQFVKLFVAFHAFEHAFMLAAILAACEKSIPVILCDIPALTSAVFTYNLTRKSMFYIFADESTIADPISSYLTSKINLKPIVNSYDSLDNISSSYLATLLISNI
jgi:hypothetical protein